MNNRLKSFAVAGLMAVALMTSPIASRADENAGYFTTHVTGAFEDTVAQLQDAVVNRGLVIDYIGHVGAMLGRTAEVAASNGASPYANAQYLQFCSAKLTHAAVAADPNNISICPYVVYAFELTESPGKITVGYRRPVVGSPSEASAKALADIDALLKEIVTEAAE